MIQIDEKTCRICLESSANRYIFSTGEFPKRKNCHEMMNTIFTFSISPNDGLPTKICKKCHLKLLTAYKFTILAASSHKKLLTVLKTASKISNTNVTKNQTEIINTRHESIFNQCEVFDSYDDLMSDSIENLTHERESAYQIEEDKIAYSKNSMCVQDELEKEIKIECDSLKLEFDDHNADENFHSDFMSDVNVTESFKEETKENSWKTNSHDSDDDNTPLVSFKSVKMRTSEVSEVNNEKADKKKELGEIKKTSLDVDDQNKSTVKSKEKIIKLNGVKKIKYATAATKSKKKSSCVCEECGKVVVDLATHRKVHLPTKPLVQCEDCPKTFTNHSGRSKHRAIHHLGLLYFCKICNKNFKRKSDHVRAKHSSRSRDVPCLLCDKKFFTAAELNRHMSFHTQEKPFLCSVCGKDFRTSTACSYHRRKTHEKERQAECDICLKKFFNQTELNRHVKESHGVVEKKYMCNQCGKCFTTNTQLKIHNKRHAGIKDIICGTCNRAFRTTGCLKAHMLTHTKEKTHPCQFCGVKFGRKDHKNNHERNVHGTKQKQKLTTLR